MTLFFVIKGKICQTENQNVESPYLNLFTMKTSFNSLLMATACLLTVSQAMGGSPVVRTLVRDAHGKARVAFVRVSDKRVLYPQIVQQIARPGGRVEYRPAIASAYRPDFFAGYGVYRPGYDYGATGIPGRQFYPVGTGYPRYYRPGGNYGVDAILYPGNRGKFGIPGYGLPGGAFPRPVVRPQLPGLPPGRYSGNVKGR